MNDSIDQNSGISVVKNCHRCQRGILAVMPLKGVDIEERDKSVKTWWQMTLNATHVQQLS